MEDKIVTMTVAEFRANVKAALDIAVEGGIIIVDRMGQKFSITYMPRGMDIMVGEVRVNDKKVTYPVVTAKKITSEPTAQDRVTPARIKNGDTPVRTDDEWQDAEQAEAPCCKKRTPCKHWVYNELTAIWQNTLSDRQREIET